MAGTQKEGCMHIGADGCCGLAEFMLNNTPGKMDLSDLNLPIGVDLRCRVSYLTPGEQKEICPNGFEAASSEA